MAQLVRDVMTSDPVSLARDATALDAARQMRENDTGAILVSDGKDLQGIVTDRDIVLRSVAEGVDPAECRIGDICSSDVQAVAPDQPVEEAIRVMREHDIRRIPVVENGAPAGILSLGDVAIARDSQSVLADISAAPANN